MNARPRLSLAAVTLALSLGLACAPSASAHGVVDGGDLLLDRSVEERALSAERCPDLDASCAALMDENGTLWFGRSAGEAAQIASLTKIMTAIVAADWLDAASEIEVTPQAASVGESSAGLLQGDVMTFDDALKALLTASGNDAASAIAQAAGSQMLSQQGLDGDARASETAFVDAMNEKAADLGLENSYFTNPHGLDFDAYAQGQYSCAADVARMMRAAMQRDLIRANIGFSQTDIVVQRNGAPTTLALANTDTMLGSYEGACAAKTGYTLAAGPCVATAVNRGDGHEYYAAVLGSSSKPQRFADSEALYDWVFAERDALADEAAPAAQPASEPKPPAPESATYQLVNSPRSIVADLGGTAAAYPVVAEIAHGDWVDRTVAATVLDADATATVPLDGGRIEQEATFSALSGDIGRGDVVGRLTFRQGGEVLWEGDLVAVEDVAAPSWWESLGVGVRRFLGGLLGEPSVAENALMATGALKVS